MRQRAQQVEKSIFTALTMGGSADQIGHEFGVPDLGWRIRRLQLAHFYGWTLASIDALSLNDLSDALAYRAAILKSRSMSTDRG